MRLTIGTPAPDFTATVYRRDPLTLSSLRGSKLWLAFFRYAGCPLCNLRVHQMIQRYDSWQQQGLTIVAVFQAPVEDVEAHVGKQNAPFPIVCDPEERLYQLYGLESSLSGFLAPGNLPAVASATMAGFLPGTTHGTKTRLPADFLIDRQGVIQDVFYAPIISEHIAFERVDTFLKS